MAETYSLQYARGYQNVPRSRTYAYGSRMRYFDFDYTQVLVGAAGDTVLLAKLPQYSTLYMLESAFWFSGNTATTTIDIGWQAYLNEDGVSQAADADGLIDGVLTTTAATWKGGALITAAAIAQSLPITNRKEFGNQNMVTIYATYLVSTVGIGATLNGYLAFRTP